jgi:hypothetical protein
LLGAAAGALREVAHRLGAAVLVTNHLVGGGGWGGGGAGGVEGGYEARRPAMGAAWRGQPHNRCAASPPRGLPRGSLGSVCRLAACLPRRALRPGPSAGWCYRGRPRVADPARPPWPAAQSLPPERARPSGSRSPARPTLRRPARRLARERCSRAWASPVNGRRPVGSEVRRGTRAQLYSNVLLPLWLCSCCTVLPGFFVCFPSSIPCGVACWALRLLCRAM